MIPVKASGWFNTAMSAIERAALIQEGLVPVNDIFYDLWDNKSKIKALRGSFGSGKSDFIATWFIKECRKPGYFRGCFGRKVLDKVRKSCHSKIISIIERHGYQNEFKYSKEPKGSMDIIHIATGNTMFAFGAKDADDMKSVDDATAIWMEEADAFTDEDFRVLFTRLRTPRADHHLWMSFNTAAVFPGHWILRYFYPEVAISDDTPANEALAEALKDAQFQDVFCNYDDNYFIDQKAYYNNLIIAAAGNKMILDAIAHGAWGAMPNENPWLYSMEYEKHCKPLQFIPSFPVYLSFDFNNDPFVCVAFQFTEAKGTRNSFLHFIKEFSGIMKIEDMCQRIKATFPQSIFFVTGDRSGQNEDIGRHQTLYQMIAAMLGISDRQLNLNTKNLEHADSRLLCNTMLYHYPHFYIDPKGCPLLIADMQKATIDKEKAQASVLLKDRANFKMDLFDAWRYALQTYFHTFAKHAYFAVLKK